MVPSIQEEGVGGEDRATFAAGEPQHRVTQQRYMMARWDRLSDTLPPRPGLPADLV